MLWLLYTIFVLYGIFMFSPEFMVALILLNDGWMILGVVALIAALSPKFKENTKKQINAFVEDIRNRIER
jgi:hypothetical protein